MALIFMSYGLKVYKMAYVKILWRWLMQCIYSFTVFFFKGRSYAFEFFKGRLQRKNLILGMLSLKGTNKTCP